MCRLLTDDSVMKIFHFLGFVVAINVFITSFSRLHGNLFILSFFSLQVIVSLLVDVPLLFSSSICLIISAVNSSVERSDGGDGVLLIAQSVLSTFIALLSVIFAVQYCCIQNTSFVSIYIYIYKYR